MITVICMCLILVIHSETRHVKNLREKDHNCGYQACHWTNPNPNIINVHLLPHSHDDVGWLKTVDQYYYGLRNNIQFAGVQYIIGSVVEALQVNPSRRFIQVETAFFWEWWKKQSEFKKDIVRKLVNNGQLVMVNGAWSMNDEATTNYQSIIDQFTLGLRKISDTVGDCGRPNIGWQIDPFGHSSEMASIFAMLGYEALFFARLDWRDSALRHRSRNMEFIWQGSRNLGPSSNIFTSILYDFYTAPSSFCWDVVCGDIPIVDDFESPDYNQHSIVNRFANYVYNASNYFQSNNVLITMGGDFTYQAAEMYFTNMDKLIEYDMNDFFLSSIQHFKSFANQLKMHFTNTWHISFSGFKKMKKDIHIFYSTPACYLNSVHEQSKRENLKYTVKHDDFFPYASEEHSYWTGYFTSRPNSKRFERQGNNLLQVIKQLNVLNYYNEDYSNDLEMLKEVMGIMQHHDAITGTEKQHVADDYMRLLSKAMKDSIKNVGAIVTSLLDNRAGQYTSDVNISLTHCLLANISHCTESTKSRFVIVVYNPLSRSQSFYVRLPVSSGNFDIIGPSGKNSYDIVPQISNFSNVKSWFETNELELVFRAHQIPPMGIHYYIIEQKSALSKHKFTRRQQDHRQTRFGNSNAGFDIDPNTGLLSLINLRGYSIPVKQEFLYYNGAVGSNWHEENRASGAYIFRPAKDFPQAIQIAPSVQWKSVERGEFYEVHQEFNSWIKQIIRVYKNSNHIEFDWLVGPIALKNHSVEIITRFTTNLNNGNIFYTDSNGREMIKRIRNYRETYNYTHEEPVSGNYYPVTSRIMIEDSSRNIQFAILNDRAQGGSSLKTGEIELMVHRRMLNDDNFGVGEPLNEYEFTKPVVVRGKHFLTFGRINPRNTHPSAFHRLLAQEKLLSPWIFLGDISDPYYNVDVLKSKLNFQFSGLNEPLPENIQILTLERWLRNTVLLRLEHIVEYYYDEYLSNGITINLRNLFTTFRVIGFVETTLGANQRLDENMKFNWNTTSQEYPYVKNKYRSLSSNRTLEVTLYPMEIRTFILDIQRY